MSKKPSKFIVALLVLMISYLLGCVKSKNIVPIKTVTADSASYMQYEIATLSGSNVTFTQSSYDGFIGGQLVKICNYGNKLGFVVPELSAGIYSLQSTIEGNQCVINIKIAMLPAITSADAIIQNALPKTITTGSYLNSLLSSTDSMQGSNTKNDQVNVATLQNLNAQINASITVAANADKMYLAKIIVANPYLFNQLQGALNIIDTNRLFKTTSVSLEQKSDSILSNIISYLSINSHAILATKAILAVPQQSYVVGLFTEGAMTFHLFDALKAAIILFNEPLINTALDISSYYRTTGNTFTVTNNQQYSFQLTGMYRNLCNIDSNSQQTLISGLYTSLSMFNIAWNSLKTIVPDSLAGNAIGFSNITKIRSKVLPVNPASLSVDSISNPNVTAIVNNNAGVLKMQFVSSQASVNQIFNFNITYNNPGLGNLQQNFTGTVLAQRTGKIVAGGNGIGSSSNQLSNPSGLWIDATGKLYISDKSNNRVIKWDTGTTTGTVIAGGNGAGAANDQLSNPGGLWRTGNGNLFIADKGNNRVVEWAAGDTTGMIVAGFTTSGDSSLNSPTSVYVTVYGTMYIADGMNNRIQKWVPLIGPSVIAGGNGSGSNPNQLNNPGGVFVDASGNIYIADTYNNRVQKWAPGASSGTTVAGGNGMGSATNQLNAPAGLFVNSAGDIYVADKGNRRIQKWANSGNVSTVATGDCNGVFLDTMGNIYVLNVADVSRWSPL